MVQNSDSTIYDIFTQRGFIAKAWASILSENCLATKLAPKQPTLRTTHTRQWLSMRAILWLLLCFSPVFLCYQKKLFTIQRFILRSSVADINPITTSLAVVRTVNDLSFLPLSKGISRTVAAPPGIPVSANFGSWSGSEYRCVLPVFRCRRIGLCPGGL